MEEPKVRDYYEDLELPFGASRKDIMQAFRRLAKIYHPDKQGPGAAADGLEFQRVSLFPPYMNNKCCLTRLTADQRSPGKPLRRP